MERPISRGKLDQLQRKMGSRDEIAKALGVSVGAVHRYFAGHGMRQETREKLTELCGKCGKPDPVHVEEAPQVDVLLAQGPQASEEDGGHLFRLLAKALQRNAGIDVLQATVDRIERRLQRIETNQQRLLQAWALEPERLAR